MREKASIRAVDVVPAPVLWLWLRRIPAGMISLVAGLPGTGKSLFGCFLAAKVSQSADVIFATREDLLRQVARPRLEAAGADLRRVHFYSPDLPEDTAALEQEIRRHRAKLVIIDPVAAHLSVPIHDDQAVRRALSPLADIAERTGCAIVLISHTIKSVRSGAHPLDAIGGSGGGLRAAARVAYIFGVNPEDADERVLAPAKSNIGPERKSFLFELDVVETGYDDDEDGIGYLIDRGECDVPTMQLLRSIGEEKHRPEKRSKAEEFLLRYLRLGPQPAAELKEDGKQYGIAERTLRRASNDLGIVKTRGPGSTWELPPELAEQIDDLLEDGNPGEEGP